MSTDLLTQHAIRITLDVIAFDADDTLWHNETLYLMTQDKFKQLLLSHHSTERIAQKLYETEMRNLQYFGYGIKGFTLSMGERILAKYNIDPRRFLMVGNSLRSGILPVLAIGGQAVYVPYHATWAHETVTNQGEEQKGYFCLPCR